MPDVVVIGGGHNGLVCAAYLAKAGLSVMVVERRHVLGGAAVTEEVFPGFKYSVCSYAVSLLRPEIIRELELARHGLTLLPLDGTFTPLHDGYLWRPEDPAAKHAEIARHSRRDADAYQDFTETMVAMAAFAKPLLGMIPPDPNAIDLRGLLDAAGLGRAFRRLGARQQHLLIQLLSSSALDFVERWFESDPLKATLASSGIIGTFLGIRSPGTAYVLLHHYMGEIDGAFRSWGLPRGGTGAVSMAIAAAATEAGAVLRTSSPVARILVDGGAAVGVVLESGEEIRASAVASSADLRVTFARLVGLDQLPTEFAGLVRGFRFRGATAKVNLALDAVPSFTCRPGSGPHLAGAISISPSTAYLERAYDDAKYGAPSVRPYMDIVIPSLSDDTVAPPGKHTMSCFVQYAPYALADGAVWDDARREALGDTVLDTLAEYVPDIRSHVLHRQVLTPLDLEREFGLSEGNIFHGELTPDQLFFMRPGPGWARHETPIRRLYLCGSSAHPGGGIMGAPGRNAARVIRRALR
jgi:phytoene dehydrogenase-like protein